jgi:CheY-like chemotaxis protein
VTDRPLENKTILIVEDDYLIGGVLSDLLRDAGATILGPIGWIDEAVAYACDERHVCDAAILDINLHGAPSYPVADALIARQIRVVFATGYGPGGIEPSYRHHAFCTKPYSREALLTALVPL